MKQKLTFTLLTAFLLLTSQQTYAEVYSGVDGNISWSVDTETGVLSLSGTGLMNDYSIASIPWYSYCSSIKSVTIHDGVTSIEYGAFQGCSSLTSVTIPESVTSIGNFAFYGCSSLTSVTIPESVTSIGFNAFYGCSSLTSVTIPEGVTRIENHAFAYCSCLTSVTIPDSVTSIGVLAFEYCSSLTSVTIPEGVTSIEYAAFASCSCLTSVTISDGVTSIGDWAFAYCNSLTSMTIPESVTSIGGSAFEDCSSLTSVTIPEGVTSIGGYAFYGCSNLTSVTIPENVASIGGGAFEGCSSLTNVTIEAGVPCILESNETFPVGNDGFKIYVPCGSGNAYKKARGWSVYADYITEYEYYPSSFFSYAFQDGMDYTISGYLRCDELSYTRTYTAGVWAAWYVPFDVVVDEDLLNKFDFAKLSGVLFEDNEWYIGAVKLKEGDFIKALVPYLVKAKSSGEQTITAEKTLLHAAADNVFSITTAENTFYFTGNCQAKTSSATDVGWYAMSTDGDFTRITNTGTTMKGGRFFMTIEDRSDNPYATSGAAASNFIRIREMGETTDVEEMMERSVDETIYDLSGRRVDEPTESGIYIVKGKKIVIK